MNESNNTSNHRKNNNDEEGTNSVLKEFINGIRQKVSGSSQYIILALFWAFLVYLPLSTVIDAVPSPTLSDNHIVFILTIVIGIPLTLPATYLIISKIYNPTKWAVAVIDGASESVLDVWYAAPDLVQNIDITDGQPRQKTIRGVPTILVNEFDPESNTAKAPRQMEITDWEMWGEKEAIERQRHRNNAFIEFGKQLFIKMPGFGQQVESSYWRKMSHQQVESELNNPDEFLSAIEDELPDLDDSDPIDEMRAVHNDVSEGSEAGDNQ